MPKMQHSPLPWFVLEDNLGCKNIGSKAGKEIFTVGFTDGLPNEATDLANAQFIVTACNSYHELLEACRLSLILVKTLEEKKMAGANIQMLGNTLEATIAKAEGKT